MDEWMDKHRTKSRWNGVRKEDSTLGVYIWSQYKNYWSRICEESSHKFGDMDLEVVSIEIVLEAMVESETTKQKGV